MRPTPISIKTEICRRLPLFARLYEEALKDHEVVVVVRTADANMLAMWVSDEVGTNASGYSLTQDVKFYSESWNFLEEAICGEHRWDGGHSTRGETVGDALARLDEDEMHPYWIVDRVDESSSTTGSAARCAITIYKPERHEGVRTYRPLLVQRASMTKGVVQSMLDDE